MIDSQSLNHWSFTLKKHKQNYISDWRLSDWLKLYLI